MRPRLIGRGFAVEGWGKTSLAAASMRPRLIGRGFTPYLCIAAPERQKALQ